MRAISPASLSRIAVILLLATLWACAPRPVERPVMDADEVALMADSAEIMLETGDPAAAADLFTEIARAVDEEERPEWLFRAADAWLQAGETDRARTLVRSLSAAELSREDRFRAAVLLSRADVMDNRPREALARLDVRDEGVPSVVMPDLLRVRAQARFQMDDIVHGVADYQRLADRLSGEERMAVLQTLWDRLMGLPTLPDREAVAGRPLVAGWINLARAGQESWQRPDRFDDAVAEWESLHRGHPARELMDRLLAEHRERFRYPDQVALLLPLSGRFAGPAVAVRDGFLAAHFNQPGERRPNVRVYDTAGDPEQVMTVYQQAIDEGAGMVVGPLTRPELARLARSERQVPVLGLNYLLENEDSVDGLFQFGLDPESEARQVAERVIREGHSNAIALVPESEWGYRMLDAFREALEAQGGVLLDYETYHSGQRDFSGRITRVLGLDRSAARHRSLASAVGESLEFEPRRRQDIDAIFLASQDGQASLIRPQLRFHRAIGVPVFASSHVYRPGQASDSDLDGIRFPDMPWSIAREGEARQARLRVETIWPEAFEQHGRLYALGFDAYRLVPVLNNFEHPLQPPLAAMTGVLSLSGDNRIQRQLSWAQFSRGQPIPLEPIEELREIEEPVPVHVGGQ
ncbi:penicillin-binding protein activator [Natronospira bacteriovora]|uniref:Penicillin-binding protein activator n=1 Tax=Natronospira bacteriovora TaxID=3069753 RepID=A0ABU0W664_9GAMM|nr:penicillin-binding protein activator [Natronospira sp. AB-CW4]MDQ2069517.1 penicillin-binding protein activator [Natronospira sp. AB-CW4]